MELAPEVPIDLCNVTPSQTTGLGYPVFAGASDLVHVTQYSPACCSGNLNATGIQITECVSGKPFGAKLGLDGPDNEGRQWREVGLADVGSQNCEERVGVSKQNALAPVDPKQVRVPVSISGFHIGKLPGGYSEESQELGRASQHHWEHHKPLVDSYRRRQRHVRRTTPGGEVDIQHLLALSRLPE
ncbi:MAG: hypothetical protein Q7T33_12685 [Dehalococcoidia bacterium]|nr:hypothetical protein [Dehalococcoidia bacterium]